MGFDPDKYLKKKSEFNPDKYLQGKGAKKEEPQQEKSMLMGYLETLGKPTEIIKDETRQLLDMAQVPEGEAPPQIKSLIKLPGETEAEAAARSSESYGDEAPPTPREMAVRGVGIAGDPLNYVVPGLGMASAATKNTIGKAALKTAQRALNPIGTAAEAVAFTGSKVKPGMDKVLSFFANLNKEELNQFRNNRPQVDELVKLMEDQSSSHTLADRAGEVLGETKDALTKAGLKADAELTARQLDQSIPYDPMVEARDILQGNQRAEDIFKAIERRRSNAQLDPSFSDAIPASEARELKQILQQEANFGKGSQTNYNTPAASKPKYASEAYRLKEMLHSQDPAGAELDALMSSGKDAQDDFAQMMKTPIASLQSKSRDRVAKLLKAGEYLGDSRVMDLSNQMKTANKIIGGDDGNANNWLKRRLMRGSARMGLDLNQALGDAGSSFLNAERAASSPMTDRMWAELILRNSKDK